MITTSRHGLSHLAALESEAIHIFREAAAVFERPALLFSGYGLLGLLAALVTRETWGRTEREEVAALERALAAEGTEPAPRRTQSASGS